MAIRADRTLSLGTLFTGNLDPTFRKAVRDLKFILSGLNTAIGGSVAPMKKATAATKELGQQQEWMGRQIGRVRGGFERLTAAMKVTAAYGLAAGAIFGVIRAMKAGQEATFGFHQAIKNLQAITSASEGQAQALGEEIREVARTTKYSVKEVSDAAVVLGQAGLSASETMDVLGAVANLATGTLSDMATTADLVTSALRVFKLESSDATMVADVFASAVNKSKLTIDKLRTAFNFLGPIAYQSGLNIKQTASAAMVLANAGLRASTIGTGFRQVVARLVAPTEKLRLAFRAAGADLGKLKNFKDFKGVIQELSKVLGENVSETERAARAFQLFGLRGASVAAVLAQAGPEGFEKMYRWVTRSGIAAEMAEKQMEGLEVLAKNLRDKLGDLGITIGQSLVPAFEALLKAARGVVDVLITVLNNPFAQAIVSTLALTAALALLRTAFRYLVFQTLAATTKMSVAWVKEFAKVNGVMMTTTLSLKGLKNALKNFFTAFQGFGIVALVTGIIIAFKSYDKWYYSLAQRSEKMIVQRDKEISQLIKFKKELDDNKSGTDEYGQILRRMIAEYPELAKSVSLATNSFRDQGRALDELIGKRKKERLQEYINMYNGYTRSLEKLTRSAHGFYRSILQAQRRGAMEMKEQTDQQLALIDLQKDALESVIPDIADALRELPGRTDIIYGTKEEIEALLKAETKGLKDVDRIVEGIHKKYQDIITDVRVIAERTGTPLDFFRQQLMAISEIDEPLGARFLELYDSLMEKPDYENLRNFIDQVEKMNKEIDKQREDFRKKGLFGKGIEAELNKIRLAYLEEFIRMMNEVDKKSRQAQQRIALFVAKASKAALAAQLVAIDNEMADRLADVDLMKNEAGEAISEAEKAAKRQEIEQAGRQRKIKATTDALQKQRDAYQDLVDAIEDLESASAEREDREIRRIESKRDELERKAYAQYDDGIIKSRKDLTDRLTDIEEAAYLAITAIHQKYIDKDEEAARKAKEQLDDILKDIREMGEPELVGEEAAIKKAEEGYDALIKKIHEYAREQELTAEKTAPIIAEADRSLFRELAMIRGKFYQEDTKKFLDYIEDRSKKELEIGLITQQQYLERLKILHDAGRVEDEEYYREQARISGDWLDQLKYGLERSKIDASTWGDVWIDIGTNIATVLSDGFATVFDSMIEGTKSAGDAFREFAVDTIKWITRMIARQLMLNAVMGAIKGIGKVAGNIYDNYQAQPNLVGEGVYAPPRGRQYGGWINEPVTGIGASTGRIYNIAEKRPEYVSPGRAPGSPNVTVKVENKTGVQATAKAETKVDASGMIISVVMDAIDRNKDGLRDRLAMVGR